jgi:hypothetical protein
MKKIIYTLLLITLFTTIFAFTSLASGENSSSITVNCVQAVADNQVKVILSGSIDKNIAENISNYSIKEYLGTKNIAILSSKYNSTDASIIISTSDILYTSKLYKLTIRNVCPNKIISEGFVGLGSKPKISVKSVTVQSSTEVKVVYNSKININMAEDINNYNISNYDTNTSIDIISSKYNPNNNEVILSLASKLDKDMLYQINIFNICSSKPATKLLVYSSDPVSIKSISAISNNQAKVFFNGYADKTKAEKAENYLLYNTNFPINILTAKYNLHSNCVTLTFGLNLYECNNYTLNISNICSDQIVKYNFDGFIPCPAVASIIAKDNKITVYYEGCLEQEIAENINNYYIHKINDDTSVNLLNATYDYNNNCVIITSDSNLDPQATYNIEVSNICATGTVKIDFVSTLSYPSAVAAIALSDTDIQIYFDGQINKSIVEDISNYYIHKKNDKTPVDILKVIYDSDNNTAILTTKSSLPSKCVYTIEVSNLCSDKISKIFFATL